jgi:hypothetical protein
MQLIFAGIILPISAFTTMPKITMADILDTYTHLTAELLIASSPDVSDFLQLSCFESSLPFPIPSSSHTHHQQVEG